MHMNMATKEQTPSWHHHRVILPPSHRGGNSIHNIYLMGLTMRVKTFRLLAQMASSQYPDCITNTLNKAGIDFFETVRQSHRNCVCLHKKPISYEHDN